MVKEIYTAGVIIECKNEILILHRNLKGSQGNTWGLPAGGINPNETNLDAAVRELYEETEYHARPEELEFIGIFDWKFPKIVIHFFTYKLKLNSKFDVKVNPKEHQGYKWITPENCYKKDDLIHGFHDLLEKVYNITPKKHA